VDRARCRRHRALCSPSQSFQWRTNRGKPGAGYRAAGGLFWRCRFEKARRAARV
jgi:hypothetical protein